MDLETLFDLEGQVAIVTGGGGYLGKAFCEALAECKATVVIASRNTQKNEELAAELTQKYGNKNISIFLDLSEQESANTVVDSVVDQFGRIDILINNSYFGAGGQFHDMPYENWEKCISGALDSTFYMTQPVLNYMRKAGYGRIINLGSMYGVVPPHVDVYRAPCERNYNPIGYGVAKAGIIHFTKYIAAVYGKEGIRCNAISPGPFPNPNVQRDTEFVRRLSEQTTVGRIGAPDDLKGAVILLASKASDYINGQNLVIDGGWTTW
jgi:gluconate 5-dehydrogenase